jgi:hypothetical protein
MVESECGFCEVRILGDEVFRSAMDVGEVASASSGDEDLSAGLRIMFKQENASVALSSDCSAHEAGSACAEDDRVEFGSYGGHCAYCRREESSLHSRSHAVAILPPSLSRQWYRRGP